MPFPVPQQKDGSNSHLCHTVHPQLHAIAFKFLDAGREGFAGKLHHLYRRVQAMSRYRR